MGMGSSGVRGTAGMGHPEALQQRGEAKMGTTTARGALTLCLEVSSCAEEAPEGRSVPGPRWPLSPQPSVPGARGGRQPPRARGERSDRTEGDDS